MYYGTFQFPNLLLNLHPDAAMAYTLLPRGPGHTTVVSEYLFRPETIAAPDFAPGAGRRAVGPHLAPGLGDLRAGPDRRRLARLRARRRLPAQGPLPVRLQRALALGDGPTHDRTERAATEPRRSCKPCKLGRASCESVAPARPGTLTVVSLRREGGTDMTDYERTTVRETWP